MPDNDNGDKVTLTTYKQANGDLIYGEFTYRDLEWFQEYDEPIDVIEEVWVLKSKREFTIERPCSMCNEPAVLWGLCEPHAREDDPEFFAKMDEGLKAAEVRGKKNA